MEQDGSSDDFEDTVISVVCLKQFRENPLSYSSVDFSTMICTKRIK